MAEGSSVPNVRVKLPEGVVAIAARETTESNALNQVVQGMSFTLRLPRGATTSVFLSYDELADAKEVERIINERIARIHSILPAQ